MVKSLFSPFFAAFILCVILAATLSTIDSQIMVITSVIAEDFYAALKGKKASEKILLFSRLSAFVTCLVALLMALAQRQRFPHYTL